MLPVFGLGETITSKDVAVIDINSEWLGVTRLQLMENAGRSVADEALSMVRDASTAAVYAGPGGNGGDGLVAARHLAFKGVDVTVFIVVRREQIQLPETLHMLEALENMDLTVNIVYVKEPSDIRPVVADIVIDALLGVGLRGAPRTPYKEAIEAINNSRARLKIAVDVPSGLNADTGETPGVYVKADVTVTFHKPKPGLLKRPDVTGKLVVASIGAPPEAEIYVGPGDVVHYFPRRSWSSHKGSAGRVLIVGGSSDYVGAPILAAFAAERGGVDLVYLATPYDARNVVYHHPTIIPVHLNGEFLSEEHVSKLENIVKKVDSIALGMGLGLREETTRAVEKLLQLAAQHSKPIVIDADGLKHLAKTIDKLNNYTSKAKIVITPHENEFYQLFGEKLPKINEDLRLRAEKAAEKALLYKLTILLKGPIDIITDGSRIRLNKTGAPAMSVGGTGDVLAGLTAALLAKKLHPFRAASLAAFINGLAGLKAYSEKGEAMTALDVVNHIPQALSKPVELASQLRDITYRRIARSRAP